MSKVILLVGPPGSGKTTLAKQYVEQHFTYVSQDFQGRGHLHIFDMAVMGKENIVVDRMNFSRGQRSRYLEVAKQNGYETEIVVLHQPRKVCFERVMARKGHETIQDEWAAQSALNTFFSKYERVQDNEADKVTRVWPDLTKPMAIVVDLDGTLCNVEHRLHHVKKPQGEKKNWKGFFEDLVHDKPNPWCDALVTFMRQHYTIVFASGRPDDHYDNTYQWLDGFAFPTDHLYMRCRGDHREDFVAKEIILDFEILSRFTPLFFIDDRKQVVDLWRSRGYVCLACAEGTF